MKEYSSKRKEMPIFSGVVKYFPDALKEVSKVSFIGNKQHNEGNELIWDKSKSTDHQDAMLRHLIDSLSEDKDSDNCLHLAKVAWRALAQLQIKLEENDRS